MSLEPWLFALSCAALSALLTGIYRQLALRRGWVDTPNHRSSHTRATPRGAGIVFALLIAAVALVSWRRYGLDGPVAAALVVGFGIALLGWWDDLRGLAARYRFAGYGLVTLLALLFVYAGVTATRSESAPWPLIALLMVSAFAMQWLINLYNFMDGINGIAAMEALFVLGAALLLSVGTAEFQLRFNLIAGIIGVLIGFLGWNFPVARVFMGDAGSAFLGFLIGLLMVWSILTGGPGVVTWLILLGVFVVDATYTLLIRMLTGQAWFLPHRSHAYQILARRFGSHSRTVILLFCINVIWLLPLAVAAQRQLVDGIWALLLAYSPLIGTAYALGAGKSPVSRV